MLDRSARGRARRYPWLQDYGTAPGGSWTIARLHDLFVRADHRQSGLGRRLHRAVVIWCRTRPIRSLQWQAAPASIAFYQHLGYHPDFHGEYASHPLFEHSFEESPAAAEPSG
ncbi:MAG: GNAT family N-acetyltransferase [Micropruina sp.]|nr:GNAT family N-acetyltransferase [Micropruina sp.]